MEQSGEYVIAASRETVWTALNDADVLGACIPGCQSITKLDAEHFDAKVKAKIGPVSATFNAELALTALNPPASYTIEGGAKGGAAGFGKGTAAVTLDEVEGGTCLRYTVNASVGGKLAQIGSRLVDGAARKMADDFFAAFSAHVAPGNDTDPADSASTADTDAPMPDQASSQADSANDAPKQRQYETSGNALVWGVAFGVLILAIVLAI